jgi:Spy/CpxP family protein refolding chaperone
MRRAAVLILMMLLSAVVYAQEPVAITANVLQLSEDQTHALVTMMQSRNEALRPIAERLQRDQEALGKLLESSNDATAIGALLLEIHASQQQAGEIAHNAAAAFEAILTPEQQLRLQFIRQAAQVEPAIQAFRAVGLL